MADAGTGMSPDALAETDPAIARMRTDAGRRIDVRLPASVIHLISEEAHDERAFPDAGGRRP
jgi:hypothetical protein